MDMASHNPKSRMKKSKVFTITIVIFSIANILSVKTDHNLYKLGFPNAFYQKTTSTGNLGSGETHRFLIISLYTISLYF
jgi:hypothetical protein